MATSRFFVANLPTNTKEKDLSQVFQDYGEVARVELKTKENLVDPENVKIIAFVTLKISEEDAHYCLNDLNWVKVNGSQIKVSLAKESFLDRLKREREEAEAAAATDKNAPISEEASAELLSQNVANKRKKFSEDVDLDDEDDDNIAPDLLISKKRAAGSLYNGKIVIQSYDTTPIHIIDKSKKVAKKLDAKSEVADQKRKESLNKKKNQYKQNKSAIQQSLSGLDTSGSKKIKFSDDEEEEDQPKAGPKTNIFGSDNEADDDDDNMGFDLKPEHFGKKGEKLLKLQSAQSLDPRFKIDAKFVDEDENADEATTEQDADNDNERNWQMGILELVVGAKIDTAPANANNKTAKNKKMLRFDPSKEEHQKFLRTKENEPTQQQQKKTKNNNKEKPLISEATTIETPEVSKEVFYMVTDSLSQSLKTRGDGFSLLNMFGSAGAQSEEQREDNLKKVTNEKILVNKLEKNALNPFSYDSSSESENEASSEVQSGELAAPPTQHGKKQQKSKIVMESFFIPKNDARLKEGAKFFRSKSNKNEPAENYEEVRNRLKMLIRTRISKSKKQMGSNRHKGRNKA